MLEARNLNKYYLSANSRLHVLKDVNLKVNKGEAIAVVGPSGAGKSTLLHILGGLDNPTSGEVLFCSKSLKAFSEKGLSDLRNNSIGFVFQFYHLLSDFTALENIMLASFINAKEKPADTKHKAHDLLKSMGIEKRANHFPAQLSGGEKQRVAIARALINNPELLLCDEPTGNLDSESGKNICGLLKSLNRQNGVTLIMVTHNLDIAALASRVYNIKDGVLSICN